MSSNNTSVSSRLNVLEKVSTTTLTLLVLFATVFVITGIIYFPNINTYDSFQCFSDEDCPSVVASPCLSSTCNLVTGQCDVAVPSPGNCFSNSQCSAGFVCDEADCMCKDLCDGVVCPDVGCQEQSCDAFTGSCVPSGNIPGCCQDSSDCPTLNSCLQSSCVMDQCEYTIMESLFNGGRNCDLQNQFVLNDNFPTVPTSYFFECGYAVAIYGNLTARVCNDYEAPGAMDDGGKIQMAVNDGINWIQTDSYEIIATTNPGFSGVDIFEDIVVLGIENVDDPNTTEATGIAIVFRYDFVTNTLVELQTLAPGDLPGFVGGEEFGKSVATNGDYIAVGAPLLDSSDTNNGGVVIYQRTSPTEWTFIQLLTEVFNFNNNLEFGFSVSMSENNLMIGAPRPSGTGSYTSMYSLSLGVFAFEWIYPIGGSLANNHQIGLSVSTDGVSAVTGSNRPNAALEARLYVLDFDDGTLSQLFNKPEPSRLSNAGYSSSVSVDGNFILAGCPRCDGDSNDAGNVFVYIFSPEFEWQYYKKSWPVGQSRLTGTRFGFSVDVYGFNFAIGAMDWSPQPASADLGAEFLETCFVQTTC